jgi:hypothetical protein
MRAAATPARTRPGATIQPPIPGMMQQSPICLRAVRLPLLELTTADGCWQEATSTSPSATARSPGTQPATRGMICRVWFKRAITSEAQPQANPSTLSQVILLQALRQAAISSTPRFPAPVQPQRHPERLRQHLRRVQELHLSQDHDLHRTRARNFVVATGLGSIPLSDPFYNCETARRAVATRDALDAYASPYFSARPMRLTPSVNICVSTPMPMRK